MALDIPHRRVGDDQQTQNLDRLKPWADSVDETTADLATDLSSLDGRLGTAEGEIDALQLDIAAMPGSFAADSISPSQVNVTKPADVVTYPNTVLNSTTWTSIGSQTISPSPAGIYITLATVTVTSLGTIANDQFAVRLLIDLVPVQTAFVHSAGTTFAETVTLAWIGQTNTLSVVQGRRHAGSGTAQVPELTIRSVRIG